MLQLSCSENFHSCNNSSGQWPALNVGSHDHESSVVLPYLVVQSELLLSPSLEYAVDELKLPGYECDLRCQPFDSIHFELDSRENFFRLIPGRVVKLDDRDLSDHVTTKQIRIRDGNRTRRLRVVLVHTHIHNSDFPPRECPRRTTGEEPRSCPSSAGTHRPQACPFTCEQCNATRGYPSPTGMHVYREQYTHRVHHNSHINSASHVHTSTVHHK